VLLFRLGSAAHPVWDGSGAAIYGGRWNPAGVVVIYAAGSLSLAMLERLVQRRNLASTIVVVAETPDDIEIDDLTKQPPAEWRTLGSVSAQAAGAAWIAGRRTALLRVPSALVPREPNYLVNPLHPDARFIRPGEPEPLEWDSRLLGIPGPPTHSRVRR
jgi:RES domain-containing protein